jgi:hypothetical protein
METTSLQRLGYLLLTILGCFLTYAMFQGTLQNVISFAGVANEIGFTMILMMLTFISGFYTVSK